MQEKHELLTFETESGDVICVEIIDDSGQEGYVQVGGTKDRVIKKAKKSLEKTLMLIAPVANGIMNAVNVMQEKPSEVEVAFNAALSSEYDFKIVTLSSVANFEIKLTWKG